MKERVAGLRYGGPDSRAWEGGEFGAFQGGVRGGSQGFERLGLLGRAGV